MSLLSVRLAWVLCLVPLGPLGCNGLPVPLQNTELREATVHRYPKEEAEHETAEKRSAVESRSNDHQHDIRLSFREGSGDGNSSIDSLQDCRTKGLCPEGIANIAAGVSAITILGVLACILWHWDAQADRKARIRHALERNKIIDQQIEEEKKKRHERAEQFISQVQEETRTAGVPDQGGLEMSLQEMTSDSELSSDERKGLLQVKSKSPTHSLTVTAEVSN